jgi:hypothetical protein
MVGGTEFTYVFAHFLSSLIFFVLSFVERGILKSPAINVKIVCFSFQFYPVFFSYFIALLSDLFTFRIATFLCRLTLQPLQYFFLALVIFFTLKSSLSDINTVDIRYLWIYGSKETTIKEKL